MRLLTVFFVKLPLKDHIDIIAVITIAAVIMAVISIPTYGQKYYSIIIYSLTTFFGLYTIGIFFRLLQEEKAH